MTFLLVSDLPFRIYIINTAASVNFKNIQLYHVITPALSRLLESLFYMVKLGITRVSIVFHTFVLVLNVFGVGVSCRNLFSFVVYLYVNGSGSITSVGEERVNLSALVYL